MVTEGGSTAAVLTLDTTAVDESRKTMADRAARSYVAKTGSFVTTDALSTVVLPFVVLDFFFRSLYEHDSISFRFAHASVI